MKLILNGGGCGESVRESYKLFGDLVGNKKVLYIPLAWNKGNIENCIDWFKGEMKEFGVTDIEQILDLNTLTIEKLQNVGGVFIGGGNTFKLLKLLKESISFDNIKQVLDKNIVFMGSSAGSMIFGKSIDSILKDELEIKSCNDENLVQLKDTTGFDILNGYSLLPHYKKYEEQFVNFEKRIERLLNNNFKLICIPEESSLFVNDEDLIVIGGKPIEVITKNFRQEFNSNEKLDLK